MEDIGKDIRDQSLTDLRIALCFSIAVDKNTDVTDIAQLCVWIGSQKKNSFVVLTVTPLPKNR